MSGLCADTAEDEDHDDDDEEEEQDGYDLMMPFVQVVRVGLFLQNISFVSGKVKASFAQSYAYLRDLISFCVKLYFVIIHLNDGQPAIVCAELGENVAEGENPKAGHVVL